MFGSLKARRLIAAEGTAYPGAGPWSVRHVWPPDPDPRIRGAKFLKRLVSAR
jgi:hypothetical protein